MWDQGYFISDNGWRARPMTLTIGQDISVNIWRCNSPNCRFIKVTPKGFNILDLDTNRCILRKHIYARGIGKRELPKNGPITGKFWIPYYISIHVKSE